MVNFKDMLCADRDRVFLNLEEFAEEHCVEGRVISAIIDSPEIGKSDAAEVGFAQCDIELFANVEQLPRIRPAGESLNVDGREYTIVSWREDFGVAQIELAQQIIG